MEETFVNPVNIASSMATINVPALKYKSGERTWYAVTLPYRVLGKFINTSTPKRKNQEIIKTEIKNRFLDPKHKNEIKDYILDENKFTIPPVTLVSFHDLDFRPYTTSTETPEQLNERFEQVGSIAGVISLPIDHEFECLDGNHRTAAIRELANENAAEIIDSNMLLNIVFESNVRKIRQDFVDVNKNAKQTSSSINTLFNTRDKTSGLVVDLIEELNYLNKTTDLLSTSVSKNSKDIFTINNIKNAVMEISGHNSQSTKVEKVSIKLKEDSLFEEEVKRKSFIFFDELKNQKTINECISSPELTPELRNTSVITSGTGIIIAARAAAFLLNDLGEDNERAVRENLKVLFALDWSRKSTIFEGNIVGAEQKILNSRDAIANAVQSVLNVLEHKNIYVTE